MTRIFIIILCTLFAAITNGQDTVNQFNANGKRQGYWQKKDSAGKIVYEGRFAGGLPVGTFRYYYPDGKLKTVSEISGDGKSAQTVSYYQNGKKMAEGGYLDEKKEKTWYFYREEDGVLLLEEHYKAGKREGISRAYYENGTVSELVTWVGGERTGTWEQYYSDGKLRLRSAYLSDEKNGVFNTFYNNGLPMMTGAYAAGRMDGHWIYYDEKGKITKKESYSNGTLLKAGD
jgi:antitoxin component YwqK of YwqJK toxin-antitoxin module